MEFDIQLPMAKSVKRTTPVSKSMWSLYEAEDGRIVNSTQLCENIFRGGLEPEVRAIAWKYLLGFNLWDKSRAENETLEAEFRERYLTVKQQWMSISREQEQMNGLFRERKSLIEKDVHRTDRNTEFYIDETSDNLRKLHDILLTYTMYNFDLGYVQGMNDILAPILLNMEDESNAFWCFVWYMKPMISHFERNQKGIKAQFNIIHGILEVLDWEYYKYLTEFDCSSLFFCFRWLLVNFKREFCYADVMRLWEVAWAGTVFLKLKSYGSFFVLVSCAILLNQRNTVMDNKYGFTEISKYVNDSAYHFDLEGILVIVEQIHCQLLGVRGALSEDIVEYLGL